MSTTENMTAARTTALDEVKGLTVWALARRADVADPDKSETNEAGERSPGAAFLDNVRSAFIEAVEELDVDAEVERYSDKLTDALDEAEFAAADDAPSIFTHTLWQEFTDLAAWTVDIEGFGPVTDMQAGARMALYETARNLWRDLAGLYSGKYATKLDELDEAEDDDDDDTCDVEGCSEPLDGDSYDGKCGVHADEAYRADEANDSDD
jgi:hypothetical protein